MKSITQNSANRFHKKMYGLLITLIISLSGFSQNVGINATGSQPNASAGLDVDFANKGLLIPRVALTSTSAFAPLSAHVAGMVVYNTATTGDVTPGFYYDNGTKWIPGFIKGQSIGDMLYWNGSDWLRIPIGVPGQYLQISGTFVPTWGGNIFATLSTVTASVITATTATVGGSIVSDGGSSILSRGVCWNTTGAPTIANSKTTDGSGIGIYTSSMTGLIAGTTYHIRSYAMNSTVINYGNEITFTTLASAPIMGATTAASVITTTSATSGGIVSFDGGATILERGICYATTSAPTILNSKVIDSAPGVGTFISNLTGLSGGTLYYVRVYATNSIGTTYGTQISFSTLVGAPTLVTAAVINISGASATSGASMSWNGGGYSNYQNYGVAYSTIPASATPTYVATNTGNGPVNASVPIAPWVTNITGLAANTTYYIRAYLNLWKTSISSWVTVFGDERSFTTTGPTAPVLTSTVAITAISANTANSGGAITSDGGSAIIAKGVCWGVTPSPVLGTGNFTSNGTGIGAFTSNITGLLASTTYYVRSYATNSIGTSYGPADVSFTTWVQAPYTIGQNVGYGVCAYVAPNGSGFIISPAIAFTGTWGCSGTLIGTSTGTAIGTGLANTNAILAGCMTRPIAASVARDYNGGGFTDWYLPSSGEWQQMLTVGSQIGLYALSTNMFYTSTESSATSANAAFFNFNSGYMSGTSKVGGTVNYVNSIIAIRSFAAATLPTVTTQAVSNIAGTTATSGGNVTGTGGAAVTSGVCWSTNPNPTIADSKTTDAFALGAFISNLTGLTTSTTYHIRAYATNVAGTSYGSDVTFSTITVSLPIVTTNAITNLAGTSVTSGGNVTSQGGSAVFSRGVCYGLTPSPDPTVDLVIYDVAGGLGTFVSNLTGLTKGQQYYLRAFAINNDGTAFGSDVVFTPSGNSLATLTTLDVTNPVPAGGTSGGDITSDGGSPVTARGVCWSYTSYPPTIVDSKTSDGSGTGSFVSTLTGMIPTYYYTIRAYATNGVGTAYGNEINYTPVGFPTFINNLLAYNFGDTFAQLVVNVSSDGGSPLTAFGAVWSTNPNPDITTNQGKTVETITPGNYYANAFISPLVDGTTYYLRSYATNGIGTAYGTEIVFTPGVQSVPVLTTDPIINKVGAIAEGGGTISIDGGSPITASGICWSTSANPDLTTNLGYTNDAYTYGQYFSNLSGLVLGTTYHVRAYATNVNGTGYGADISFVATPAVIGQSLSGGLLVGNVFSVDATGLHGLLADQWGYGSSDWGCTNSTANATGTTIGTGQSNTAAINANIATHGCVSSSGVMAFASEIAMWNGIDWYLPSKDELNLMWTNRVASGLDVNMSNAFPFWSSSEVNPTNAWYFDGTTWQSTGLKTSQYYVWPIRSF